MEQKEEQTSKNSYLDLNNEIFYTVTDTAKSSPYKVSEILAHYTSGKYYVQFYSARTSVGEKYVLELEEFSLLFQQGLRC